MLRAITLLAVSVIPVSCPMVEIPDRSDSVLDRIAASIARHEGWLDRKNLVHRLHNPGALVYAKQKNAKYSIRGFAQWRNDEQGWNALRNDLRAKFKTGKTLEQVMHAWDHGIYLNSLVKETRLNRNQKLAFAE